MKKFLKEFIKEFKVSFFRLILYIITFIILISLGIFALYKSALFPTSLIEHNVQFSSYTLIAEGNLLPYYSYVSLSNCNFDSYTDAVMINNAYSIDSSAPYESIMYVRKNYIPGFTKIMHDDFNGELKSSQKYETLDQAGDLYDTVFKTTIESFNYSRYWHGYLVFLRPLLLKYDLEGIRNLLNTVYIILAILITIPLFIKFKWKSLPLLLIGLYSVDYYLLHLSLQSSLLSIVTIISSIYLLCTYTKKRTFTLSFFIIGAFSAYVDFLTTPMMVLGINLLIYFSLKEKYINEDFTFKSNFIYLIKLCFTWCLGYFLMWAAKWFVIDFTLNTSIISNAFNQIGHRSETTINYLQKSIWKNYRYMIIPVTTSYIILILSILIRRKKLTKELLYKYSVYFLIALIPIAWIIVITEHSEMHAHFIHRILTVTVLGNILYAYKIFIHSNENLNNNLEEIKEEHNS